MEKDYEEKVVMMRPALKTMTTSSAEQLLNWVFVPQHGDLALTLYLSDRCGELKASQCGDGFCLLGILAVITAVGFVSRVQSAMQ